MNQSANIVQLTAIYHSLGDLQQDVIFSGRAVVPLYISNGLSVDGYRNARLELTTLAQDSALQSRLQALGFSLVQAKGKDPVFRAGDTELTVPPISDRRYLYLYGFQYPWLKKLDDRTVIRLFCPEYFIARKLDAFLESGIRNVCQNPDFRDMVLILQNRPMIWAEMAYATPDIYSFLRKNWLAMMDNGHLYEWIDTNLQDRAEDAASEILSRLKEVFE